jgi:radical SAM superfamily enzyme YgiQ (UPF0313 family)
MKVLLVQSNYLVSRKSGAWLVNPPLGLAYIAAVLEEKGFKPEILDANVKNWSPEQVAEYAKGYDIVGISVLTPAERWASNVARLLPKKTLKVAGGPHSTGYPEDLVKKGFDISVIGEGEYTFLEIAEGKDLSKIEGICYNDDDNIITNPLRKPIDPNELPLPSRHLLINNGVDLPYISAGTKYRPWSPIFTSRGCPFDCNYCMKKVFGYQFRPRTPENVMKEIRFLVNELKIKELAIYDDTFNFDLDRAEKILDMIIAENIKVHIRFTNGIRADKVNENFLMKLKKAGCNYVAYGIESGNQEVLNKIPKCITLDQIREAVKLTKEVGIPVSGFFMFGLFGDTKETMQQTINFAKEVDLDMAAWNLATPYPGTKMFEEIKKNGKFLFDLNDWHNIQHTSGRMMFTHPDVASLKEVEDAYARAYKEFYLRPRYIIKQIIKIRSWTQFVGTLKGVVAIMKAIFRRQPDVQRNFTDKNIESVKINESVIS